MTQNRRHSFPIELTQQAMRKQGSVVPGWAFRLGEATHSGWAGGRDPVPTRWRTAALQVSGNGLPQARQSVDVHSAWLSGYVPPIHLDDPGGAQTGKNLCEGPLAEPEGPHHPPLGEADSSDLVVGQPS